MERKMGNGEGKKVRGGVKAFEKDGWKVKRRARDECN